MNKSLLLISILTIFLVSCGPNYDEFAQCLTDKGVKMYGAFWCPHCTRQKEMFGSSFDKIDYVECSLPDKSRQTEACISANITGYPTWEFSFNTRQEGVLTMQQLSQKTECKLP